MGSRRQARELALQVLYLKDGCGLSLKSSIEIVMARPMDESVKEFSQHLVEEVLKKQEEIDQILSRYTENWELGRMAIVDRNILRLAALEILTHPDTPLSVVIDEAIEIAKTYSTEESGKFVNGILDQVKQERKIHSDPSIQ